MGRLVSLSVNRVVHQRVVHHVVILLSFCLENEIFFLFSFLNQKINAIISNTKDHEKAVLKYLKYLKGSVLNFIRVP